LELVSLVGSVALFTVEPLAVRVSALSFFFAVACNFAATNTGAYKASFGVLLAIFPSPLIVFTVILDL
jgi:hypothetical protein